ncbi:hypothetical protein OG948_58560 (plasmid) [Embleya sp. NBC_00888]|uniref:hypothetical protein n=1 Tax=Embleya sp. NBC_00888 TaxID=2975960 RepID=UPI002F914854|nr:hypothetical protein OG948_58560 [Embleya sp. NBC_00888]
MRGAVTIIGLATALMTIAGCSDDPPATKKTPPPSAPSPTASTSPSQAEALATYRNLWTAATKAAATANAEDPELRKYAHDDALAYFVGSNLENKEKGVVVKGEPGISPRVVGETGDRVTLADCVDGSHWLKYRASDGKLADDVPGGHHQAEATVTRTTSGWRVTSLTIEGVGTC